MQAIQMFLLLAILVAETNSYQHADCGKRSSTQKRIVGGTDVTSLEKWPWMVQVQHGADGKWFKCGGTLISPDWVLTAGHCMAKHPEYPHYIFQVADLKKTYGKPNIHLRQMKKKVVHPKFNPKNIKNGYDIALAQLAEPVPMPASGINSICLPIGYQQSDFVGANCWAAGWGDTNPAWNRAHVKPSKILKEVENKVWDDDTCKAEFPQYDIFFDRQMCTGTEPKRTGEGDSGGPTMCEMPDGRWVQAGVVSHGEPDFWLKIQTKVVPFLDWILQETGLPSNA